MLLYIDWRIKSDLHLLLDSKCFVFAPLLLIVCVIDGWMDVKLFFKSLLLQFLSDSYKSWAHMISVPIRKKLEQIFEFYFKIFWQIFKFLRQQ